jgi:hypothetical protein
MVLLDRSVKDAEHFPLQVVQWFVMILLIVQLSILKQLNRGATHTTSSVPKEKKWDYQQQFIEETVRDMV